MMSTQSSNKNLLQSECQCPHHLLLLSAKFKPLRCGYCFTANSTAWLEIGLQITGTLKAFTYSSKPSVAVIETCTKSQDINFGYSLPNVFTNRDCLLTVSSPNEFLRRLDIYDCRNQKQFGILFWVRSIGVPYHSTCCLQEY